MITVSFLLAVNGYYLCWELVQPIEVKNAILYGMLGLAAFYGFYLRKQKERMLAIQDFDKRIEFHQQFFKKRMWWYVISIGASCVLYLLVANRFFLYFALLEFVILLVLFPNKYFFRKELQDDDIVFL